MGFYAEQLLPRVTDAALRGRPIEQLRRRATAGLAGVVLEVGSPPAPCPLSSSGWTAGHRAPASPAGRTG